jgi:nucleotide-binding universal stress UspA family protein
MTTYVVGVDRSTPARAALEWTRTVAASDDDIIVAHARDLPATTEVQSMDTVHMQWTESAAEQFLARVVTEQDDRRITGRLTTGHAGTALVELAEQTGSDVAVVVGHRGSTKTSLLLGSTAHYVAHHTEVPVVVVRGDARLSLRRVVVGVDDDDDDEPADRSLAALRWAMRMPGVQRIEVSHADFVPGIAAGPVRQPGFESDDVVAEHDSMLRLAVERATDGTGVAPNGAEVVRVVAAGTAAFALIEASRTADLVVVGTRARSGLLELILGSTSLEVLAHAHCPVAIIR